MEIKKQMTENELKLWALAYVVEMKRQYLEFKLPPRGTESMVEDLLNDFTAFMANYSGISRADMVKVEKQRNAVFTEMNRTTVEL